MLRLIGMWNIQPSVLYKALTPFSINLLQHQCPTLNVKIFNVLNSQHYLGLVYPIYLELNILVNGVYI